MLGKGLLNKDFILLFQGQLISQIGSAVYMVSLIFWLKHATGSATIVGLFFMMSLLPGVLLGPIGGAVADLYSRKKIIVLGDLINGCLILIVGVVMLLLPTSTDLIIILLFFTALSSGIVRAFFRPAVSAAVPDLVPGNKIEAANALLQGSVEFSTIIGQALGGILYKLLGAPVLMLVDGISYLLSALSESFITISQQERENPESNKDVIKQLKVDMLDGFNYVRRANGLQDLFLVFAVLCFFVSPFPILLPFFVEDTLHSTPDWYGFLMGAWAVGILSGNGLAAMIKMSPVNRYHSVIIALLLYTISIAGLGYSPNVLVALCILFVSGIFYGFMHVLIMSAVQITTPGEIRGRVLGLLTTVYTAFMPIGAGLAGVVADLMDQNIALIFFISGACMFLVSCRLLFSDGFHELLSYDNKKIDESLIP